MDYTVAYSPYKPDRWAIRMLWAESAWTTHKKHTDQNFYILINITSSGLFQMSKTIIKAYTRASGVLLSLDLTPNCPLPSSLVKVSSDLSISHASSVRERNPLYACSLTTYMYRRRQIKSLELVGVHAKCFGSERAHIQWNSRRLSQIPCPHCPQLLSHHGGRLH